jgi:hypothetical protein
MWTDGQTDMMKLIVAFSNYSNEPKTMPNFHVQSGIRLRDPSLWRAWDQARHYTAMSLRSVGLLHMHVITYVIILLRV